MRCLCSALTGRHVQRLRHLPLQTPQEAAAGAWPLVLLTAGQDGGVLLLQEPGEWPVAASTRAWGVFAVPTLNKASQQEGRSQAHLDFES